jgi:transcriptional regulator with XRE-family HTH domain
MVRLSTDKGFYATINCGFDKEYNPPMEYLDYAGRLKELQTNKGIKTQIELSAWMGFSKSIISAWMRGEKIPSMDTALKIATMFDVCVEWLLTGKGPKHPNEEAQLNLNDYINVTNLTPEQLQAVKLIIAQFEQTNPVKAEHKALTSPAEKEGGG